MKQTVTIVGGGACALMLACELDPEKFNISIYEKNAALGRKFLVAGDGGLNLTHSENQADFIKRYTPSPFFEKAFSVFSNKDLVTWLNAHGIGTYTGSSGRIFPEQSFKPIDVLNVFLDKINKNGVKVFTKHTLKHFSLEKELVFEHKNMLKKIKSDLVVFCLGGASWPVTGSTGDWDTLFEKEKIKTNPFRASNCAFRINWPEELISKIEGDFLKNISITCDTNTHWGEIVFTKTGIEGSGIYPLSPQIRMELEKNNAAEISIDLKPVFSSEKILEKLNVAPSGKTITEHLKKQLNFTHTHIQLLKHFLSKKVFLDINALSENIKKFNLVITGTGPVEEAISTAGGISVTEIDDNYQLKKLPGHFAIGEMLDYDAPTGGYLLQSCFSMANYLALYFNSRPGGQAPKEI